MPEARYGRRADNGPRMRIVSLLPAATEIVFALGLGDELAGRTALCSYPPEVALVPVVGVMAGDLPVPGGRGPEWSTSDLLAHAAHGGGAPLRLDADAMAAADPDLVLSQALCPVCEPLEGDLARFARGAGRSANIVRLHPASVEGILNAVSTVGAFTEAEDEAVGLVELLRERLAAIENRILERRLMGVGPPRVVVLTWLDPPYAAGQWVPEMVRRAGGWDLLGQEGEAPAATTWERVRDVDPESIVVALPVADAGDAADRFADAEIPPWFGGLGAVREGGLFAVDGASLLARPGPRVIDGIGLLAELFDPEGLAGFGSAAGWIPLDRGGSPIRTSS